MPSTRRQFLATSGAALGALCGCLGRSPPSAGTESPTDTHTGTPPKTGSPTPTDPPESAERTLGGTTVAVTDIVARKAVTYRSTMGDGGVVAPADQQFVVATVRTDADLSLDAFTFRTDDGEWPATVPGDRGALNWAVAGHEGGAVGSPIGGDGPSFVAFRVDSPTEPAGARIRLAHGGETATWSLPGTAAEVLPAPSPSFDLDSLSVPDRVRQGESLEVSLTVTNTSDTAGRFLAAVYWPTELIADDDESHLLAAEVGAGETVQKSLSIDTAYTATEDGPVTLAVDGYVQASREVTVTGAGTEA